MYNLPCIIWTNQSQFSTVKDKEWSAAINRIIRSVGMQGKHSVVVATTSYDNAPHVDIARALSAPYSTTCWP